MTTHPNQYQKVLQRLQRGPATTFDLIMLGICCPTKRISELRKNHEILSTERRQGRKRIVTYRLLDTSHLDQAAPCVPVRSQGTFTRLCDECRTPFQSVYSRSKFCSTTCRTAHWKKFNPNRSDAVTPERSALE